MGRQIQGDTKREKLVAFRLNDAEARELDVKRRRRGITTTSAYFRTLMTEDDHADES